MTADLKHFLREVGADETLGWHGVRVEGYNNARDSSGRLLAGAHGGWHGDSDARYARFRLVDVFGIAPRMVGEKDPYAGAVPFRPSEDELGLEEPDILPNDYDPAEDVSEDEEEPVAPRPTPVRTRARSAADTPTSSTRM